MARKVKRSKTDSDFCILWYEEANVNFLIKDIDFGIKKKLHKKDLQYYFISVKNFVIFIF